MKFLLVIMLSLGSFFAGSASGNEDPISSVVLESFQKDFSKAEQVSWSIEKEFYKVHFLLNCQHVYAFYTKDGSRLATTRNMLFTELPVVLQTNLKELNKGYWISDLFELSNEEGTRYYITLENADTKLILRSVFSTWEVYQKKIKP